MDKYTIPKYFYFPTETVSVDPEIRIRPRLKKVALIYLIFKDRKLV